MLALIGLGVTGVAVAAMAWWLRRRWDHVDSYYEREQQDPPAFDAGSWLGGDRL